MTTPVATNTPTHPLDSSCRIISLVPYADYNITQPMAVRRPVAVIGRPLGMPTLDGHTSYRSFQIEAGGRLDLRYVRIFRGECLHSQNHPPLLKRSPPSRHKNAHTPFYSNKEKGGRSCRVT